MDVESDEEGLLEDLHMEGVAPIVRRHVEAYAVMKGIKVADALLLLVQAGYNYLTLGDLPGEMVRLHGAGAVRRGKKHNVTVVIGSNLCSFKPCYAVI